MQALEASSEAVRRISTATSRWVKVTMVRETFDRQDMPRLVRPEHDLSIAALQRYAFLDQKMLMTMRF